MIARASRPVYAQPDTEQIQVKSHRISSNLNEQKRTYAQRVGS